MLPGAGDELQGIKKGLIELADLIAVNKADGEQWLAAEQARRHYANALRILLPEDVASRPDVLTVSALTGAGLPELWAGMLRWLDRMRATGQLDQKRRAQQLRWLDTLLHARLLDLLDRDLDSAAELARCRAEVAAGAETPLRAVERVLAAFASAQKPNPMPTPTLLPELPKLPNPP
jgi:LAO/AO transport system kinase